MTETSKPETLLLILTTRCAVCHNFFEDGGHLFLKCKDAKQRWRALLLKDVRLKLLPCWSAVEMLEEVLNLEEKEKMLTIAFLWSWWQERNRGNHGETRLTIDSFQFSVRRHASEWHDHLKKIKETGHVVHSEWEAPTLDYVKINVDAAFREETMSGGWGAIGRDSVADICFASAGTLQNVSIAMHAEAVALANSIQIAEQMGMGRVVFETDCLNLKQAMTTSDYSFSPLGNLISDMKFSLQMNFIEASVVYAPRTCNRPAHVLAAMGVGLVQGNHAIWTSDFPTDVTRLVTGVSAVS